MKALLLIFSLFLLPGSADAGITMLYQKYSTKELMSWAYSFAARTRSTSDEIECARLSDLPDTVFCLASDLPTSAATFVRMSEYVEGSAKGEILDLTTETYKTLCEEPTGHDLRSSDMFRYFRAVEAACKESKNDPGICLTPSERNIFEQVIVPQSQISSFVLLAFDVSLLRAKHPLAAKLFQAMVTHELNHAKFFNDLVFQKAVINFWKNKLTEQERTLVIDTLEGNYNTSDEFLMQNEFQAYVLQYMPEVGLFLNIYQNFLDDLLKALAAVGKAPVRLENY